MFFSARDLKTILSYVMSVNRISFIATVFFFIDTPFSLF